MAVALQPGLTVRRSKRQSPDVTERRSGSDAGGGLKELGRLCAWVGRAKRAGAVRVEVLALACRACSPQTLGPETSYQRYTQAKAERVRAFRS